MNTTLLDDLINDAGFSHTYENDRLKQLILLTVEQCIKELNDLHYSQTINNQNYPDAWHSGVDSCISAIKNHFEVK